MINKIKTILDSFKRKKSIKKICKTLEISNYKINKDFSVDVDGDVLIPRYYFNKIPIQFGSVSGSFDCRNCSIETLEGCPKYVGQSFLCGSNRITSLEFCPEHVGLNFMCQENQLSKIENIKYIGGDFHIENNRIKLIDYLPTVDGDVYIEGNLMYNISIDLLLSHRFDMFNASYGYKFSPFYFLSKFYSNRKSFIDSLECYNFIRPDGIIRSRFMESLEEKGINYKVIMEKIMPYYFPRLSSNDYFYSHSPSYYTYDPFYSYLDRLNRQINSMSNSSHTVSFPYKFI